MLDDKDFGFENDEPKDSMTGMLQFHFQTLLQIVKQKRNFTQYTGQICSGSLSHNKNFKKAK